MTTQARILCIDVGNTNLYAGVFQGERLLFTFRRDTAAASSADELGIFFRAVLRENDIDPFSLSRVGISSVVPSLVHSLRNSIVKYFRHEPFLLKPGVKTGLKITAKNPAEVGSDRIANAISTIHRYPQQNAIIIDFGTATTFCPISKNAEFLGGLIIPGIRISMEGLASRTARLPQVDIVKPNSVLGRTSIEAIQSGLFYSTIGAIKEICAGLQSECFQGEKPLLIGTGGFSRLLENEHIFDLILPDLVLDGIRIATELNPDE